MTNTAIAAASNEDLNVRKANKDELRQLVCFKLGDEDFGVNIYNVQEINRMVEITKIPQSVDFVEGVINLRGQIIPVVDLRKRFGFSVLEERSKDTRIVVVESDNTTVGFIVDQVTEVLRIPASSVEPTPELAGSEVDARYIEGVALLENRLLIVLNVDQVFMRDEISSLDAVVANN